MNVLLYTILFIPPVRLLLFDLGSAVYLSTRGRLQLRAGFLLQLSLRLLTLTTTSSTLYRPGEERELDQFAHFTSVSFSLRTG